MNKNYNMSMNLYYLIRHNSTHLNFVTTNFLENLNFNKSNYLFNQDDSKFTVSYGEDTYEINDFQIIHDLLIKFQLETGEKMILYNNIIYRDATLFKIKKKNRSYNINHEKLELNYNSIISRISNMVDNDFDVIKSSNEFYFLNSNYDISFKYDLSENKLFILYDDEYIEVITKYNGLNNIFYFCNGLFVDKNNNLYYFNTSEEKNLHISFHY